MSFLIPRPTLQIVQEYEEEYTIESVYSMPWKSITSFSHSLQTIDSLLKLLRKYLLLISQSSCCLKGLEEINIL